MAENYGLYIGLPTRYTAETRQQDNRSPHIHLYFTDNNNEEAESAINVKSKDKTDHNLIYWFDKDFTHPITDTLRQIKNQLGFRNLDSNDPLSLDFLRTSPALLDIRGGTELPHDIDGPNNDVLDHLEPILDAAVAPDSGSVVFIWGSGYTRGDPGIHDVHMNQGSVPPFDNSTYSDGALIFYFPQLDRFEAVFLAFATQKVPTDDNSGNPSPGSKPLGHPVRRRGHATTAASANDDGEEGIFL